MPDSTPAAASPQSAGEQAELPSGTRLKCPRCGSEAIVTQGGPATLRCCGADLEIIFSVPGRPGGTR